MRNKNKKKTDEINFWQSSSDLMTGLLLILMLIILLLILYLMQIPDREYIHYFDHESEVEMMEGDDTYSYPEEVIEPEEHQTTTAGVGGGGGGGDGDGEDGEEGPEEEPGEYPEGEEGTKSAVFVKLVDGETNRVIMEEGVKFDLHSQKNDKLQILNTYYPEKISFKNFFTTAAGTFYLPEKIPQGSYYIRNLTEAKGYELAANAEFELDELYDWPDPYVVTVAAFPARNTIQIHMKDRETGEPVSGGSFEVIAAEDITTLDGTIRYQSGDIVDEITCNDEGFGESEELYLGSYKIKQKGIPEYYASTEPLTVNNEEAGVSEDVPCDRTKVKIRICDELHEKTSITGAMLTLSDGETSQSYQTDDTGEVSIDTLKKNTTYKIHQKTTAKDYRMPDEDLMFAVSADGRINTEAEASFEITNRILRLEIEAEDAVLRNSLSSVLTLYDMSGNEVKTWHTSGDPITFTDIPEGEYYIVANENDKKHFPVTVRDTKEVQRVSIEIWTMRSYIAIALAAAAGVGILTIFVVIIRKIIRRRKQQKENKS